MFLTSIFQLFVNVVSTLFNALLLYFFFFFFNDPAPPEFSPLPLHAALPISVNFAHAVPFTVPRANSYESHKICRQANISQACSPPVRKRREDRTDDAWTTASFSGGDRKRTRLNSSHGYISYAVFCLKKKTKS